jgi:hypothetical protein
MAKNRSSISNAATYGNIGEYWDTHDLDDHWDETYEVNFEVSLDPTGMDSRRTSGRKRENRLLGDDDPPPSS